MSDVGRNTLRQSDRRTSGIGRWSIRERRDNESFLQAHEAAHDRAHDEAHDKLTGAGLLASSLASLPD